MDSEEYLFSNKSTQKTSTIEIMILAQRPLFSSLLKSVHPKEGCKLPRSDGILPEVTALWPWNDDEGTLFMLGPTCHPLDMPLSILMSKSRTTITLSESRRDPKNPVVHSMTWSNGTCPHRRNPQEEAVTGVYVVEDTAGRDMCESRPWTGTYVSIAFFTKNTTQLIVLMIGS